MRRASFVLWCAVLGVCGTVVASPARGQSAVSIEGVVGGSQTIGGTYANRHQVTLGWGAQLEVPIAPSTQLTVGGAYVGTGLNGDKVTTTAPVCWGCTPPPPDVPDMSYVGATVGLRHALYHGVGLEAGAGLGKVDANSRRHTASSWNAGISFPFVGGISLVFGIHMIRWTMDGNTLYAYPVAGGLRLRF